MKIKDLPEMERPRERLLLCGVESLSLEELLAIIIKTGTKKHSSKHLAEEILSIYGIDGLKDISVNGLCQIEGIGKVKAIEIISAIELGKRIVGNNKLKQKYLLKTSKEIYEFNKYLFTDKKQECFYCLYFNNKQELIERKLLFMGTINRSVVHPREVFKEAYLCSASSIVCMHNHPSGDIRPSLEDKKITNALIEIGRINGIPVVDHIIFGDTSYYSFYDDGKIINM